MSIARSFIRRWVDEYTKIKPDNDYVNLDIDAMGVPDERFTTRLDVKDYMHLRKAAAAEHHSEISLFDTFPESMHADVFGTDHLILVAPEPTSTALETDLFEGL